MRLGPEYDVWSKGYLHDKETDIQGRYVDKRVDITIKRKTTGEAVAGLAVKFVMQNYSQNSNNYFENMLGETANIRCAACPYFQIFIIFDKLPYYNKAKVITRWETFTGHNIEKYTILSQDNINVYLHTPNKTLIYVIHVPDAPASVTCLTEYLKYYRSNLTEIALTTQTYPKFSPAVILNDYEEFIDKVYHTIKAL